MYVYASMNYQSIGSGYGVAFPCPSIDLPAARKSSSHPVRPTWGEELFNFQTIWNPKPLQFKLRTPPTNSGYPGYPQSHAYDDPG